MTRVLAEEKLASSLDKCRSLSWSRSVPTLIAVLALGTVLSSCCPPAGWQAVRVADPRQQRRLPDDPAKLIEAADRFVRQGPRQIACLDLALSALKKALQRLVGKRAAGEQASASTARAKLLFEVRWRLARTAFLLAEVLPARDQRRDFARSGAAHARQAIAADSRRVEGHYYLAVNLGKQAELTGDLTVVKPAVAAAERAIKLDERFDDGGPLVFLGKVLLTAPPWPVSVGNPERAVDLLERALRIAPRPLTRLFLGEAYYEDEQYERAARQIRRALEGKLAPRWRREADEYLRRIREGALLTATGAIASSLVDLSPPGAEPGQEVPCR